MFRSFLQLLNRGVFTSCFSGFIRPGELRKWGTNARVSQDDNPIDACITDTENPARHSEEIRKTPHSPDALENDLSERTFKTF